MKSKPQPPQHRRILREPEVADRTGLSRSQRWRLTKLGKFPRPVPLGDKASGHDEAEIDAWIEARVQARDEQAAGAKAAPTKAA